MREPTICLILSRWGGWPAIFSVVARTIVANPTVRFQLLGDKEPELHGGLPPNAQFKSLSLKDLRARVRKRLGKSLEPASLAVAGFHSKISDLKPMFGALFPELLRGCDWWGYMQEDEVLGSLRSFATPELLSAYDVVSPLPLPCAGPFMLWRNTPAVTLLYQRSAQWRDVVENPRYLAFDEWGQVIPTLPQTRTARRPPSLLRPCTRRAHLALALESASTLTWGQSSGRANLTEHMGAVVRREARAGRLRAFMPDDARGCGASGGASSWLQEDVVRECGKWWTGFYDETMHFWWRDGTLWAGAPDDTVWAEARGWLQAPLAAFTRAGRRGGRGSDDEARGWLRSGRRAVAHLIASKRAPQYRDIRSTPSFLSRVAGASEMVFTRHGLFLRDSGDSFAWYSGLWPGTSVRVAATAVHRMASQLRQLGLPLNGSSAGELRRRADQLAPCPQSVSLDDPTGSWDAAAKSHLWRHRQSCAE